MKYIRVQAAMLIAAAMVAMPARAMPAQGDTANVATFLRGKIQLSDDDGSISIQGTTIMWKNTKVGIIMKANTDTFAIERVPGADTLVVKYTAITTDVPEHHDLEFVNPENGIVIVLKPIGSKTLNISGSAQDRSVEQKERITRRDLSKAACCSLAESFEKSPTVEVSFSDAATGARQIQLLGLRGQYTQFMVEAVPLIRSVEMPYGLDHIPGPFMQSVNISKGAATVATGHESMTGQISINLLDPTVAPALYVNVYGNTMSRMEANILGSQIISDELSTATMVHYRTMPHAPDNNNDGFMDLPTFSQINGVHRWLYNDDEVEVQGLVRGLYDTYESGTVHNGDAHHDSASYRINTDITRVDGFLKLGFLNAFEDLEGSSMALTVNGAYHKQNSELGLRTLSGKQNTVQVRALAMLPFDDRHSFFAGASGLYEEFDERLSTTQFARIEREVGMFGEWTFKPTEDVSMIAGLRYDHNSVYGGRLVPRIHASLNLSEFSTLRASIGRGWRAPSVIVENMSAFVNNRTAHFDPSFKAEDSYNAGISYTISFDVADRPFSFSTEFYRTEFSNQIVVDYDRSARDVYISNLVGRSWSNSVMAQLEGTVVPRLSTMIAVRYASIISPYNGSLQMKPLTSQLRVLFTASWSTPDDSWQADATISWNNSGRIPTTAENPVNYQMGSSYPGWWRVNAQLTKRFGAFEVYVGSENLTNMIQQQAVLASDAPRSEFFDASLVWGPMDSRLAYVGFRYTIDHAME